VHREAHGLVADSIYLLGLAWLGLSWSFLIGAILAILQAAEPTKMGRVMSLFAVVLLGGTTIGSPLATALTTVGGPRAPFVVGSLAAVVAAAARFSHLPRDQGALSTRTTAMSPGANVG
jgi:MFS family permease